MRMPNFASSETTKNIIPGLKKCLEPFAGINFVVFMGTQILGFQSVSGISKRQDVEYIAEGGRNDYPLMLKKPQSTPHKLTFKRGYRVRTVLGSAPITDMMFGDQISEESGKPGMIFVLGRGREIKALYGFCSQGIEEWTMSDLDAERSEPCIETFTISHTGLCSIPVTL